MLEEINELIEKNKKNSSLSKRDKETYRNKLSHLLKANEYTEELETILLEGPNDLSMNELAKHLSSIDTNQALSFLNKFINSNGVKENKGGAIGNRFVYLFSFLSDYIKELSIAFESDQLCLLSDHPGPRIRPPSASTRPS